MIKIGVIGVGHLGEIHLKCLRDVAEIEVIGCYDVDTAKSIEVSTKYGIPYYKQAGALIDAADAIDIVCTTTHHLEYLEKAIQRQKHIFVEKPIVSSIGEIAKLKDLLNGYTSNLQVGHVERFNPAWLAICDEPLDPQFIEVHRLALFNQRALDVSVVTDLMIHDLDIILHMVKSPISNIQASGVSIVSQKADICNARIEFNNGCVANITASRISMKNMRKCRIFNANAYFSLDFLEKKIQTVRLSDQRQSQGLSQQIDTAKGQKWVSFNSPNISPSNAIEEELRSFANSILQNSTTAVSVDDGIRALEVALEIDTIIEKNI